MHALCQTPEQFCQAGVMAVNAGMGRSRKVHASRLDAFNCYKRYLTKVLGYTMKGQREFAPPDGGPVLVLTKKIRYGAPMRKGKQKRYMPKQRTGGTIIG